MIGDNHAEADVTCDFHKVYEGGGIPIIDYGNVTSDLEAKYGSYKKDSSFENDKELLFTFPGFHTKGVATHKLNGNGSDELLAERINNSVLGGYNDKNQNQMLLPRSKHHVLLHLLNKLIENKR